jgi:NADH:ubiquinone oxidoreductase subunit 4 (subunit M)
MVRGFESGFMELFVAIMAGSVATLVTLGYEFRAVWRIYYGKLPENLKDVSPVPLTMAITLIAFSALSVIFGIWPALITNPIEVYIEHLFH